MSATEMVSQWQQAVKEDLLAGLHGHQAKAVAVLSWAMAMAGSCAAAAVAPLVPSAAKPASVRRRMERLLANDRLDAAGAMLRMSRSLLRDWGGRKLLLILDETPKQNHLRCMKLSVAYHKRTVTLLSICYPPDRPPMPMPKLVRWILRQVAACLPAEGVTVTLLADRGLCWPTVIRQCRRIGWHYLLRLQSDTRIKLDDGTEHAVSGLAPRPGVRWFGQDVRVFKKARWLHANVVAVWEPASKVPWLLVSDHSAVYQRCQGYCKRTWCEESHRDEKSHGLNWQKSQVHDPAHAQRLALLIALATLLCIAVGARAIKRGLRRRLFEPRARRLTSVFTMGQRYLGYLMAHNQPLSPTAIALPPP